MDFIFPFLAAILQAGSFTDMDEKLMQLIEWDRR